MAPACKFWLQGYCRYGNSCRFEHPSDRNSAPQRNQSSFARGNERSQTSFGSGYDRPNADQRGRQNQSRDQSLPYGLNADTIRADLTDERPIWILSAYGPGIRAPAQLFGGLPREQSFEEMRLRHYELAARGQVQQAVEEARSLHNTAADQMRVALQDIDGAIDFIIGAEKDHPNRIDICKQGSQGSASAGVGFSQRQPNDPTSSFGRPSMPASELGRPSTLGGAFGQSSSGVKSLAPGFSQSPPVQNPFGPASSMSTPNPFSRVRGNFGAPAPGTFGAPAVGSFGQPSSGSFAAPPNSDATMESPGRSYSTTTGGLPAASAGAFGRQPTGASDAPFNGGFRQLSGTHHNDSPSWGGSMGSTGQFAANGVAQTSTMQTSGMGRPEVQRDASGRLKSWGGKQVSYTGDSNEPCIRRPDGAWEKIWFPDGPPARNMPQEIPSSYYNEHLKQEYTYLAENGKFKDGVTPQFPPKWEWTSWDF